MTFQPRRVMRRRIGLFARLTGEDGRELAMVQTVDVSDLGARFKIEGSVPIPEIFRMTFSLNGSVQRLCRTVWRSDCAIGVRFLDHKPKRSHPPEQRKDAPPSEA